MGGGKDEKDSKGEGTVKDGCAGLAAPTVLMAMAQKKKTMIRVCWSP